MTIRAHVRKQRCGLILLCLALLIGCGSKVTQQNLDKVQIGMSQADVTAILGDPTESNNVAIGPVSTLTATWKQDNRTITIQFLNGKVIAKAFSNTPG